MGEEGWRGDGAARCGERKGEQTFTCVRNYSRTSGVQMFRMRCVRHVMPSGGSCKVKGPPPPEGGRGGAGEAVQAIRRITTVFADWENVGIVGPFHSLGAI